MWSWSAVEEAPTCLKGLTAQPYRNAKKEGVSRRCKTEWFYEGHYLAALLSPWPWQNHRQPGHCLQDPSLKIINQPGKAMTSFKSFDPSEDVSHSDIWIALNCCGGPCPLTTKLVFQPALPLYTSSGRPPRQGEYYWWNKSSDWTKEETHTFVTNVDAPRRIKHMKKTSNMKEEDHSCQRK